MKFLTEKELRDIIKNNGKLVSYSEAYDLYVTTEKQLDKATKIQESKVISLTKAEYDTIKNNKKEDLLNYLRNNELNSLTNFDDADVLKTETIETTKSTQSDYSISSSSTTDYIDAGALKTSLEVSDVSTATDINKILGINFEWTTMPYWVLTDGLGLAHTADYFDNYIDKDFYVMHYTPAAGGWHTEWYDTEWDNYGVSGTWDPKLNDTAAKGRMYEKIGNSKSFVPQGAKFSILGQYGHKQLVGGIAVTIGKGTVGFTPTFSGTIAKSTQIWLNNIITY